MLANSSDSINITNINDRRCIAWSADIDSALESVSNFELLKELDGRPKQSEKYALNVFHINVDMAYLGKNVIFCHSIVTTLYKNSSCIFTQLWTRFTVLKMHLQLFRQKYFCKAWSLCKMHKSLIHFLKCLSPSSCCGDGLVSIAYTRISSKHDVSLRKSCTR